jgi:hypothetical protein
MNKRDVTKREREIALARKQAEEGRFAAIARIAAHKHAERQAGEKEKRA